MYYYPVNYPYPYEGRIESYPYWMTPVYGGYPYYQQVPFMSDSYVDPRRQGIRDRGNEPYVVNIEKATEENKNFRTALWTGKHLQVTLMNILPGQDIGLEVHPDVDQFLRIEQGQGMVLMGDRKDRLTFTQRVFEDFAIMVPAGKWHNIVNTGRTPLKLYSIYAPPEHPFGTVHKTQADAKAAEQRFEDSNFY